ncbi:MAG: hypothetical protein D6828_01420, partial [Nitrospirae bacterium]
FIESLSTYARLFIEKIDRPDVDDIRNLRPAVALQQQNTIKTSRSTVGTLTEIHDYLRLLFSKIAQPYCPICGKLIKQWSPESIVEDLISNQKGKRAMIIFPSDKRVEELIRMGYHRFREDGEVILDRLIIGDEKRLTDSIETAWSEGGGEVIVDIVGDSIIRYTKKLMCSDCGFIAEQPHPMLFSFNHPLGACPACRGFGNVLKYVEDKIVPDKSLSLKDMAIEPWSKPSLRWWYKQLLRGAPKSGIDINIPYRELTEDKKRLLFKGTEYFYGLDDFFSTLEEKKYKLHVRVFLSRYREAVVCSECGGKRLKAEALSYKVASKDISEFLEMSISDLKNYIKDIKLSDHHKIISEEILKQIYDKLS